jgi:hypothetical protein
MEENINEKKQEMEEKNEKMETAGNDEDSNNRPSGEQGIDLIAEAKKVNEELKANLEERRKLIEREEKLTSRQEALRALGGGSNAGTKPKKVEETPKEYKDRIMRGEI